MKEPKEEANEPEAHACPLASDDEADEDEDEDE